MLKVHSMILPVNIPLLDPRSETIRRSLIDLLRVTFALTICLRMYKRLQGSLYEQTVVRRLDRYGLSQYVAHC